METRNHLSLGSISLFDNRHSPFEQMPVHHHADPYICIVLDGAYTESSRAGHFSLGRGAIVGHPAGDRHANAFSAQGGRCLNIAPTGAWRDNAMWMECLHTFSSQQQRANAGAILRLNQELSMSDPLRPLGVLAALFELLQGAQAESDHGGVPVWLKRVRDLLQAAPAEHHTLADLAIEAGVHPSHLARAFRRWQGQSIGSYARKQRLAAALEALASARAPIADIAMEFGFTDQAHLTRAVKLATGMTPRAFKNAKRVQEMRFPPS